jgi:peptide/nickel transport system substrate-binding protein
MFSNGAKLTSADVAYSFQRILNPASFATNNAALFYFLDASGISTPDPLTVVFRLKSPNAFFPLQISDIPYSIVPNGAATATGVSNTIGSGPFVLSQYSSGATCIVTRNANYWAHPKPYLDGVTVVGAPDVNTRYELMLAGQVDHLNGVTSTLISTLPNTYPVVMKASSYAGLFAFADQAPFTDPRVIQALKYGIDRNTLANIIAPEVTYKRLRFGHEVTADQGALQPGSPAYPSHLKPAAFDPAKAKSLLSQAGFSNGLTVPVTVSAANTTVLQLAVAMQNMLQAVGVTLNLNSVPAATFTQALNVQPNIVTGIPVISPPIMFQRYYQQGSATNYSHFNNAQFQKLFTQYFAATHRATQDMLAGEMATLIDQNATNLVAAWVDKTDAVSNNVHNYGPATFYYYNDVWMT